MEFVLIKPESKEWTHMWEWIAKHPLNDGLEEPTVALNEQNGEAWQYMGSFRSIKGDVISEFRHRCHPIDNERHYLKMNHENGVAESDIDKVIPVK